MSDAPTLTRALAESLAHSVLEPAAAQGLRVSVAVVDHRGLDLVVLRGDDATWFTPEVARTKARTAAAFGRPSASLAQMKETCPELFDLVSESLPFRATALPGGIQLELDGRLAGGLGVSGAHPDQDVDLARAAVSAVLGGPPTS